MRKDNELLATAYRIVLDQELEQKRNVRRMNWFMERLEFHKWYQKYSGERYVFPLPISGPY